MPINRVKDSKGRARFEFEFSRRLGGRRKRTRKLLPAAWTRAQADAFDRNESARLYAEITGVQPKRFSIGQAVARYLVERAVNLKTGKGVAMELRLMQPWFDGRDLSELPDVCAKYVADSRTTLAPATLRNRLRYLTAACRWSWKRHGMGEHDPAARVVMPAVSNEKQIYLTRRQMLQLARHCGSWEVRAMIRISFYSGMRLGEIQRARIDGDCWVLDDTKNGEPRIIPMHARCRAYSDYLWPSKGMVAYWTRIALDAANSAEVPANIPARATFHTLRHSAATAMLKEGVQLHTVGAVLGHKSSASMKRYAHHATQSLRDAVDLIGGKPRAAA